MDLLILCMYSLLGLAMMNEASIQAQVRLDASKLGWRLFRNNVGVLVDSRGIPVRFGLANDSNVVNKHIKSADLIGIKPVLITQDMVGQTIGQFVSRECKWSGWKYNPKDEREAAQQRWIDMINSMGGDAKFTTGEV